MQVEKMAKWIITVSKAEEEEVEKARITCRYRYLYRHEIFIMWLTLKKSLLASFKDAEIVNAYICTYFIMLDFDSKWSVMRLHDDNIMQ